MRPPYPNPITVYLSDEDYQELLKVARYYGLTASTAARMMIRYCLKEVAFFKGDKPVDPAVVELLRLIEGAKEKEGSEE